MVAGKKILQMRVELTAEWIRLNNEVVDTLYCLPGMIGYEGHVACMEEERNVYIAIF